MSRRESRSVAYSPFPVVHVPPRAGMTAAAYVRAVEEASVEVVRLSTVHASQRTVCLSKALMFAHGAQPRKGKRSALGAKDDLPVLARIGGKLVCLNGTHRLAGALLAGKRFERARVIRGILRG